MAKIWTKVSWHLFPDHRVRVRLRALLVILVNVLHIVVSRVCFLNYCVLCPIVTDTSSFFGS